LVIYLCTLLFEEKTRNDNDGGVSEREKKFTTHGGIALQQANLLVVVIYSRNEEELCLRQIRMNDWLLPMSC
jgi:hypothetical protein